MFGPDLKICWFAVTRPGLEETCGSIFVVFFFMLIPQKKFFSHRYIILAIITLENKVNLLLFSSASFFKYSYCFDFSYPLSSAQVSLDCGTLDRQINQCKASPAAIRNTNDQESFQM